MEASLAASMLARPAEAASPITLDPNKLAKFVDRLNIPPIAKSVGLKNARLTAEENAPLYRIAMQQVETRMHRDLPSTKVWAYGSTLPGPIIEARCGQPLFIEWANELPEKHLLPIDYSIHGARKELPEVRTIVHLHGGRVPAASDGYPENWYAPGKSVVSFYPNKQDATTLWYHDHAMAITRLNVFAGLMGLYIIRDDFEDGLGLPKGEYEIPIVLFDRSFRTDGQLYYPVSPDPQKPWVSEFFGDAILANGKLFPFADVTPSKYRLRLLNASNSRFCYLSFSDGSEFWQIGSDQGLLAAPVELKNLTLAPAERADIIVDFKSRDGKSIVLRSDTYDILQFRVSGASTQTPQPIPNKLRPVPKLKERDAVKTRELTLGGGGDPDDPTTMFLPMLLNDAFWHDPVTENPRLNTTEIWSLVNVTDDSHPIHLHLVRFQVLDRRPFDVFTYLNERKLVYTADAIPPDENERGWKDTARADPGVVTRIIIHFEGFAGRYVWHCHVLEHEDYEMMRPYDVLPA
ncbi:MAG TPA: multicopper oxidase domain-containing protein [Bryobacteraceae bacterium]|nr:multicopper oxidase domain-containing protein [Bryobacteraceae bacterium]